MHKYVLEELNNKNNYQSTVYSSRARSTVYIRDIINNNASDWRNVQLVRMRVSTQAPHPKNLMSSCRQY